MATVRFNNGHSKKQNKKQVEAKQFQRSIWKIYPYDIFTDLKKMKGKLILAVK